MHHHMWLQGDGGLLVGWVGVGTGVFWWVVREHSDPPDQGPCFDFWKEGHKVALDVLTNGLQ